MIGGFLDYSANQLLGFDHKLNNKGHPGAIIGRATVSCMLHATALFILSV